ncbi:LacI family transcriptional regulator [Salipaludibacillus neizhouensis]|uniref:LacI family transcriptional regulator n=1 Tax=Salipaludibacillus neizhouensis TaxID=885475 RepID=A0A3A9K6C2_9BACI|nr:LacI family DNA-binding transcriptional regulator [Salipaludibacillus neizhouensis]RKL66968.1 LacI family transcriptional regulator [Salipaludibacillus neizhouensis]
MKNRKVTMQLIADRVGYSKYVVSKTLNGKPGVNEATRKKILFVAKQLGYLKTDVEEEIDKVSLNTSSDSFVLVVMPNHRSQNTDSDYWSVIFNGVLGNLENHGIGAVAISNKNKLSDNVKTSNLLGIITVGLINTELLLELNKHQVPLIMVDHEDSLITADSIFMNNIDGLSKLTSHLIGLGHKSLKFVGDLNYSRSFYDRSIGFRTAMEQNDLISQSETGIMNIEYDEEFESNFISELVDFEKENRFPTGFICANDAIAKMVMDVLINRGYSIPGDFSVTGFDNLNMSSKLNPPLTSVQVLKEVIGKRAVSKLLWRIKNIDFPSEKIFIASEIIIRPSVDVPRKESIINNR